MFYFSRRKAVGSFSLKQKCYYYGTKLFLYSALILLFSHLSGQVDEKSEQVKLQYPASSCFQIFGRKIILINFQVKKLNISDSIVKSDNFSESTVEKFNSTDVNSTITTTKEPEKECVKAAIQQFPRLFIDQEARKYGAIIFHIVLCIYSFTGLAITCDNYFVTSLDRICEGKS